jgi:hypothetical protein
MPNYIFAYHGGKMPENPEDGAKLMARWQAWMGGLGEFMVIPGAPLGQSKTISSAGVTDDGGANPLSGYTVVKADSMDAALEMAKACPHLDHGSIEVAEEMKM